MEAAEYEKMYIFEEGNWWYKGRRELLLDIISIIKEELDKAHIKILDTGCGTGLHIKALQRYGDVNGLDFSKEALRFGKSRGNTSLICGSGDRLPFKSSVFDIVCALDVLEHIEDDLSAIREMRRVLSPGGYLILTVPAFQFLWSGHDLAAHHKRRYDKSELLHSLGFCGFRVCRSTYWNFLLFPLVALILLLRKEEQETVTDLKALPGMANSSLLALLRLEKAMIRKDMSLPVGVSSLCVCRKGSGD